MNAKCGWCIIIDRALWIVMVGGNEIHGYSKDALKIWFDEPIGNHIFFICLAKYYKHVFANLSLLDYFLHLEIFWIEQLLSFSKPIFGGYGVL